MGCPMYLSEEDKCNETVKTSHDQGAAYGVKNQEGARSIKTHQKALHDIGNILHIPNNTRAQKGEA